MKTYTKSIFAAIATLFVAQISYAEEPTTSAKKKSFAIGVYASQNTQKMNLIIENNSTKPLTIKLKDIEGKVLYTETIYRNTPKYWRKFDVSELNTAKTQIEVSNGTETISQDFEAKLPTLAPLASTIAMGMYQVNDSQKIKILVENQGDKPLELSLKSQEGEVLYSETIGKKTKKYARKFDMTNLTDGNYSFEINNGTETISKELSISTKNGQIKTH